MNQHKQHQNHKQHQKHAQLQKPRMGQWGRCEYAILGTSCSEIQNFALALSAQLKGLHVVYIDESHSDTVKAMAFHMEATRHKDRWDYTSQSETNSYINKLQFNATDIQLINGNHFKADRQIVFLNEVKRDSLQRKKDRLTNVKIIVKQHKDQEIYPFLKPLLQADTLEVSIDDLALIGDSIKQERAQYQTLSGLILAGGKSTRMGFDKGKIDYHGQSQVDHLSALLKPFCDEVFVSLRPGQEGDYKVSVIEDSYQGFGPMSGILSAFKHNPNAAWLTVATDLPFISEESISNLIDRREEAKIASCYIQSQSKFPDPLFTIWEPKAYVSLLNFVSLGYACPRKVLINSDVNVIPIDDDRILMNVNDPDSLKEAKSLINS